IVGINVEPDSDAAQKWLAQVPVSLTFPILFDRENKVAESFGVDGMPSTVFIDRTGAVRYVHRGYRPGDEAKYADMVRSLVKE
ncbi:MAG TPA: TlpA disulfide reductase family protein, partial [Steroidobacteraceae bacterium]|nr:TlpA disulfide reductase family protein [Steroidobacteraceae bacterium]